MIASLQITASETILRIGLYFMKLRKFVANFLSTLYILFIICFIVFRWSISDLRLCTMCIYVPRLCISLSLGLSVVDLPL